MYIPDSYHVISITIEIFVTDVGWFARRTACSNTRTITITEGTQGIINLKTVIGLAKQVEKTITLGEEHTELLPNGQESKVVFAPKIGFS